MFESSKFSEFYDGVKINRKLSALFHLFFIGRRVFLGLIAVLPSEVNFWLKIIPVLIMQVAFFAYNVMIKPMEEVRDQILEVLNESLYLFFVLCLILFGDQSQNWTSEIEQAILYSIIGGGLMITLVTVVFSVFDFKEIFSKAR